MVLTEGSIPEKAAGWQAMVHKATTPQFGLIAEDVEKVNPDLIIRDAEGIGRITPATLQAE